MSTTAMIFFWSLAYACMVIYSFIFRSEKKPFMPLISGALNFGWEIHALITSGGYWGQIVWLTLDCFILTYNLYILESLKKKILYVAVVLSCIAGLHGVFSITAFDGMLISSFVIDIIMAIEYICAIQHISLKGRTLIGIFRLLGDLFAWIANRRLSVAVFVIGSTVLLINLFYVVYSFELEGKATEITQDKGEKQKQKRKR